MRISRLLRLNVVMLLCLLVLNIGAATWDFYKISMDSNLLKRASMLRSVETKMLVNGEFINAEADKWMKETGQIISEIGMREGSMFQRAALNDSLLSERRAALEKIWDDFREFSVKSNTDPAFLAPAREKGTEFFKAAALTIEVVNAKIERDIRYSVIEQAVLFMLSALLLSIIWVNSERRIGRPLRALQSSVTEIANGDLTVTVASNSKDEIGQLSEGTSRMAASLRGMVEGFLHQATQVVGSVKALQKHAEGTSTAARSQSRQAGEIAVAAEQMSGTIREISKNIADASGTSAEAMRRAREGERLAVSAVERIEDVRKASADLDGMLKRLDERLNRIVSMASVINDIADQTNLLALNAAIEAARAGEQGRGFSVVADEVRKLAERTIGATKEITNSLSAVRGDSTLTRRSMDEAAMHVSGASATIHEVGDALGHIVIAFENVREKVVQVATAVEEQAATSNAISGRIEDTARIALSIETMAEEVKAEVAHLCTVSLELRGATSKFKIVQPERNPQERRSFEPEGAIAHATEAPGLI